MRIQCTDEGGVGKKGKKKKCIENARWKETEPLDVLYKVPVGCEPAEGASQEIPDKRILQEEKAERSMRQLSVWLGWPFEEPNRQKILQCQAAGRWRQGLCPTTTSHLCSNSVQPEWTSVWKTPVRFFCKLEIIFVLIDFELNCDPVSQNWTVISSNVPICVFTADTLSPVNPFCDVKRNITV